LSGRIAVVLELRLPLPLRRSRHAPRRDLLRPGPTLQRVCANELSVFHRWEPNNAAGPNDWRDNANGYPAGPPHRAFPDSCRHRIRQHLRSGSPKRLRIVRRGWPAGSLTSTSTPLPLSPRLRSSRSWMPRWSGRIGALVRRECDDSQ